MRVRPDVGIYLVPPLMSEADNIASTRNFFHVERTEVFETHRNCASGCSNHLTQDSPNGQTCALEQSAWQPTLKPWQTMLSLFVPPPPLETRRTWGNGCSSQSPPNSPTQNLLLRLRCAHSQSVWRLTMKTWQRTLTLFKASPIERWTHNAILRLAAGRWRISYRLLFLVRIGLKRLVGSIYRGGEGVVE